MNKSLRFRILLSALTVSALAACGGPGGPGGRGGSGGGAPGGGMPKMPDTDPQALSEYQILGISVYRKLDETDIAKRLREPHKFNLNPNSCILLVQSGADTPDKALVESLAKRFRVSTVSGVPDYSDTGTYDDDEDFRGPTSPYGRQMINNVRLDKAFRLAAVKAGADTIVVVWKKSAGKGIPGVRAAVIDVETGKWEVISPLADEEVETDNAVDDAKAEHRNKPKEYPPLKPEELVAGYEHLAATLEAQAKTNPTK
jgi:hypothetical protein